MKMSGYEFEQNNSPYNTWFAVLLRQSNNSFLRSWVDLLAGQAADLLRKYFRRYVETSLEAIRKLPDVESFKHKREEATAIQGEIPHGRERP